MGMSTKDPARGRRIRELREQAGLNQQELADKLNVSRVAVTKYELGQTTPAKRLPQLAAVLNTTADYIINGEDSESSPSSNIGLGARIQNLRKEHNITKQGLARECNVPTNVITSWECNKTQPSLSLLALLADKFNVTTDYLLGVTNKTRIPDDSVLADNLLEQLYSGQPDVLAKLKGAQIYLKNMDLSKIEKQALKSNLDLILAAKGII